MLTRGEADLDEEVIFEDSLHRQCQQITQGEPGFIGRLLTLLYTTSATTSVQQTAHKVVYHFDD